jgi:hypothetical protein
VLFALQRDKVAALRTLVEHGADLGKFDVGHRHCFVEWAKDELGKEVQGIDHLKYSKATAEWGNLMRYSSENSITFKYLKVPPRLEMLMHHLL